MSGIKNWLDRFKMNRPMLFYYGLFIIILALCAMIASHLLHTSLPLYIGTVIVLLVALVHTGKKFIRSPQEVDDGENDSISGAVTPVNLSNSVDTQHYEQASEASSARKLPPYITPSNITVKYSKLDSKELTRVLYDRPPKWIICLLFYLWAPSINRDYGPRAEPEKRGNYVYGKFVGVHALSLFLRLAVYTASVIVLMHVRTGWPMLLIGLLAFLEVGWIAYSIRTWRRERHIITLDTIMRLIRQYPWRGEEAPFVPTYTLSQAYIDQTRIGKLLRYWDIEMRTTEETEVISVLRFLSDEARLRTIFDYFIEDQKRRTLRQQNPLTNQKADEVIAALTRNTGALEDNTAALDALRELIISNGGVVRLSAPVRHIIGSDDTEEIPPERD